MMFLIGVMYGVGVLAAGAANFVTVVYGQSTYKAVLGTLLWPVALPYWGCGRTPRNTFARWS